MKEPVILAAVRSTSLDCVRLLGLLRDAGPDAVAFLGVSVVLALLPSATALATSSVIAAVERDGTRPDAMSLIAVPLAYLAVAMVFGQVLTAALAPQLARVTGAVNYRHRARVALLVVGTPSIEAVERPEVQDLVEIASGESGSWVERTAGNGATSLATICCQALGAVASGLVLATFAWWLLPLVLLPAFASLALSLHQGLRRRRLVMSVMTDKRRFMYFGDLSIAPSEGKELRIFGLSEWLVRRGRTAMDAHRAPVTAQELEDQRKRWKPFVLCFFPLLLAFAVVGLDVAHGRGALSTETAVLTCAWSAYQVVAGIWDAVGVVAGLAPLRAYQRLRELLGEGEGADASAPSGESTAPTAQNEGAAPGNVPRICFEEVSFRYEDAARTVLDRLDLEIVPGELLGLVGLNGAGKSTLTKLLTGLYRPESGRITADGVSIADAAAWRRSVTVVFQDFVKYPASALDNVTFGYDAAPDREAAEAAAHDAGFDQVVAGLAKGWDTPLVTFLPGGTDLSGGQWQQVALARAFYAVAKGARVIVLDEPTAHLDVQSEFEVFKRLRDVRTPAGERVSVVLISHRLSSVRDADRIVLLEDGRITEDGTHDALMALDGRYAAMFSLQATRFAQGYDDREEEAYA